MSSTLRRSLYTLLACSVLLLLFIANTRIDAASGVPCDSPRLPTPAEVLAGAPAGIPGCPSDFQTAIGDDGSAKAYLNSLPKNPLSICAPPNEENIRRLDPTFAVCAASFLKAYRSTYGEIVITSAFRDGAPGSSPRGDGRSANQCADGAPGSNHQKGIAMDVYPAVNSQENFERLWSFASQNPQFGVCFPYGAKDRPHMTLAGTGTGEAAKCAAQGVTKACSGLAYDPNTVRVASGSSNSPTSELTNQIRELLGLNEAQQGQSGEEEMCRLPDGWEVPCSKIANYGAGSQPPQGMTSQGGAALPAQSLPSSQQPTQHLQPPTNSISPTVSPTTPPETSQTGSLPKNTEGLSALERLQLLAGQQSQTSAPTAPPFVVVVRGEDAKIIQEPQEQPVVSPLQEDVYRLTPVANESTFTSSNFSGDTSSYTSQQTSGIQKVLADMQEVLLKALEYLRPFGRPHAETEHRDGYY